MIVTVPSHPALPANSYVGLTKRELFALAFALFHGLTPAGGVQRADELLAALNKEPTRG